VRFALVLEHGCEKVHNEYLRTKLRAAGHDPGAIGWASIQLDGGIEETRQRIRSWFAQMGHNSPPISEEEAGLESLGLGILTAEPCPKDFSGALAVLVNDLVGAGGTVVMPSSDPLLKGPLLHDLGISPASAHSTLPYGAPSDAAGLHLMDMPTDHWVERLSGIGASGVEMILAYTGGHPLQGHPLVPVIQVGFSDSPLQISPEGFDLLVSQGDEDLVQNLYRLLVETASRRYLSQALQLGNVDFQMTRGPLGFSV
jgi:hypothetical protein